MKEKHEFKKFKKEMAILEMHEKLVKQQTALFNMNLKRLNDKGMEIYQQELELLQNNNE